jgi:hypothetical protein
MVAKIDFTGVGETITANNFDISTGPYTAPTLAAFNTGSVSITSNNNLNNLAFDTLSFHGSRSHFDEIRIGTTFDDVISIPDLGGPVVPEPSTLGLAAFSMIALCFHGRRGRNR